MLLPLFSFPNSLSVSFNVSSFSLTAPYPPFFLCEQQKEHEIWSVRDLNPDLNLAMYMCVVQRVKPDISEPCFRAHCKIENECLEMKSVNVH